MPQRRKEPPAGERGRARKAPEPEAAAKEGGDEAPVVHGVWSGTLSFGLVTIPVELFSATRRETKPLRMLASDGTPLARRYVCPAEERELERDEIARGYEVEQGQFVLVTDEELEAIAPRRSRDIELQRFVERSAIDPVWFERPYYLLPGEGQTKAYRLLAETMEEADRAALATFVMRGKGYAVAIFAERGVLRAETLRFHDELRSPEALALPEPRREDADRVAAFLRAIESLAQDAIDPDEIVDDQAGRVLELAHRKARAGDDVFEAPQSESDTADTDDDEAGGEVVDLFALVRARLRDGGAEPPKRARRSKGE